MCAAMDLVPVDLILIRRGDRASSRLIEVRSSAFDQEIVSAAKKSHSTGSQDANVEKSPRLPISEKERRKSTTGCS